MTTTDDATGEEVFDPRSVPSFPTVNVRVKAGDDGHMHGEVDGQPVEVDDGNPIASVMAAAAAIAAKRPMRAVRVSATDTEDETWLMVVHADGRTWDLDASTNSAAKKASGKNVAGMTNRALAGLVAGTLVLATAGLGATWWITSRGNGGLPPKPTAAPAGESPVVPVQGWARRAAWVSPILTQTGSETGVLSTNDSVITTLDADAGPQLAALRPEDGATLWTSPLPTSLSGPPQLSSYDGREAIAAASDSKLIVWPNNGQAGAAPTPTEWDFTEAALKLVPHSPVPVLASEDTNTALVLNEDRLEKRVVPAGAHVIRADDDGNAIAVDEVGRWWELNAESTAPSPTMLQPPTYGAEVREVLGMAGRTLIVSWTDGEDGTMLAGYAAESSMKPAWKTTVSDNPTTNDFHVSPDGTWAIAGTTAIRSETGKDRRLPEDWKTVGITNEAAWAKQYVAKKLATATEMARPVEDDAGVPVATTDDGRGLILAADGQDDRLYALEADPGRPYDAGEPVTPSPTATKTAEPSKTKAKAKAKDKK